MKALDTDHLVQLLEQGQFDQAKSLIEGFFEPELTKEEKGAALVNLATLYMDFRTKNNERYSEFMQEAIDSLKSLKTSEDQLNESIALGDLRKKLQ